MNGYSQTVAAQKIGADMVQISKWERGVLRPGMKKAWKISQATDGAVPVEAWMMERRNGDRRTG